MAAKTSTHPPPPVVGANIFPPEDADIFFTGQRVHVLSWLWSGKRSGVIKYLGETKFEKGVWAGVALDDFHDLRGQNDGCVNGIRYFQCPPKICVFSRLSELTLTLQPLENGQQSQPAARQTISILRDIDEPMRLESSGEFSLGDGVIVTSSRGSAAGTLRYLGVPGGRAGIWAGVKLDSLLGFDDGTMAGPLRIDCPPVFQVLASITKVSLAPTNEPNVAIQPSLTPRIANDVIDLTSDNESSPTGRSTKRSAVASSRTEKDLLVSAGKLSCMGRPGCLLPLVYQLSCPQHYQSVQVVCSHWKCIGLILGKQQKCGCVVEHLTAYHDTVTLDDSII